MARISASVYTSHVPAVGAAIDLGKTAEPYWQPVFKGYDFSKQWLKEQKPDVKFDLVPAAFGGIWDVYARVYYTALTMGVADITHDALFKALHEERIPVKNMEDIANFYAEHGVDKA